MNHENLSYGNSINSNDKQHVWKAINKLKWNKRLAIFGKEEQENPDILDYIYEQNVRKEISMNLSSDEDDEDDENDENDEDDENGENDENDNMLSSTPFNG